MYIYITILINAHKCFQICISIPCNKSLFQKLHYIYIFKMECFVLLCPVGEGSVLTALVIIVINEDTIMKNKNMILESRLNTDKSETQWLM